MEGEFIQEQYKKKPEQKARKQKKKSPTHTAKTMALVQKAKNLVDLLKKNNASVVFAVYNCKSGENKIIKIFKSYQAAEVFAVENCHKASTGLQIRKVFVSNKRRD